MSSANDPTAPPPEPASEGHQPYIPDSANIPEFTWPSLIVGAILGIIFGASSLYLLMKVSMTVSASVPIAVLSITLFRAFSKWTVPTSAWSFWRCSSRRRATTLPLVWGWVRTEETRRCPQRKSRFRKF